MSQPIKLTIVPSLKKYCSALHINDEYFCELHFSIFSKKPPLLKSYENLNDFKTKFTEIEYKGALQYSVRRLSLKNQPSIELKKALKERHVSSETIDRVIKEFQRLGYVDDHQWFTEYAASLARKNYGPKVIVTKLRLKGLSQKEAEKFASPVNESTDQKAQILHLIHTKFKKKDLSDFKSRQKVISALYRKGFAFDDILTVLKVDYIEE